MEIKFPLRLLGFLIQVLSGSVVCQSVCECMTDVHLPQSSPGLNLTLQSYKRKQMLEARSFQLVPLKSSFLKVEVSSTSAVLNWTDWTSAPTQHVCVDARCPVGWIASGWNCFQVRQDVQTWPEAQRVCESSAPGLHLASVKTDADFLSLSDKLQSHKHHLLLLLWTSLNDRGGYFTGLSVNSVQKTEAVLSWPDVSRFNSTPGLMLNLHVHDRTGSQVLTYTPLRHTLNRKRVNGLSPGHIYYISLSLRHTGGATQTLGPIFIVKTIPNPPQNITVTGLTSSQIALSWAAPDSAHDASFERYFLYWLNIASGSGRGLWLSKGNLSAVIGGLEAYNVYRISLVSVTAEGVESAEATSLDVVTKPQTVRDAVPYAVDTESVVLFVQMPTSGVYDGLAVTYGNNSIWIPMSRDTGISKAVVGNLTPGTVYEFQLFVTSRGVNSDGFRLLPVRTLPSSVTLVPVRRTASSLCVSWSEGAGVCDAFMVSIKNSTYNLQMRLSVSEESFYAAVPAPPEAVTFIEQEGNAVYVTWTQPLGQVTGYRVTSPTPETLTDTAPRRQVIVHGNHAKITDLVPGSDYTFEIQTFLEDDFSKSVSKNISTSPAGVCSLSVSHFNSSSVTLAWGVGVGHFDFHRVTISNESHLWVYSVQTDSWEYTVSGLRDGCSYNTSVERVRNTQSGTAATLIIHTVPALPEDVRVLDVSPRLFSLYWRPSSGCDQRYSVHLSPDHGNITILTTPDGHVQANVSNVTSGTQYTVTVSAVGSSGLRSAVSRSITTTESVPAAPFKPEGERVGSNGILLSWKMPSPPDLSIHSFVIRYKEMCPHPDPTFTEVTKSLDIPETLLNTLSPGATYNIKVAAVNKAGVGPFSQSLYIKTAESPPGMVTNLTAFAQNHSSVVLKWFLPVRINGLITKFAVKAKHARTGQTVRTLELNAEEIMNGALPHCNNLSVWNITSRILSLSWESPTIITGRFSYVIQLYGPAGLISENSTNEQTIVYNGLTPYTRYRIIVMAKSAGATGPATETRILTPSEVAYLRAVAVDSTSVRLSWGIPNQPNGLITRYRILVLHQETLVQDITLRALQLNGSQHGTSAGMLSDVSGNSSPALRRSARSLNTSTAAESTTFSPISSSLPSLTVTEKRSSNATISAFTLLHTAETSSLTLTSTAPVTHPPWLALTSAHSSSTATTNSETPNSVTNFPPLTSGLDPGLVLSSAQPRMSTRAVNTGLTLQPRDFTQTAVTSRIDVLPPTEELADLSSDHITYVVTRLNPFTDYNFSVSAFTTVGEGPARRIAQKTQEQVPSSVQDVSYENISSTSIFVSWNPPLNPNGKITHYTVYILNLHSHKTQQQVTNTTSIILTGLDKYTQYRVRVAAWTAAGESPVSDEDNIAVLTLEDEPDSPPHNLLVLNTTSSTATITWSPPDKPNGIIVMYEVTYSNATFSFTVNSTTPSITLHHLKPYTLYNLTVRGYTRLGYGDQTSSMLHMLSGEDVPGSPPYGLSYDSISSSEVNVSWSPPLVPNGVVLYYSVEYWNTTHTLNITTHTPFVLLSNLRKYARYRVSVQAATRVGLGNHSSEILNITTLEDAPSDPPQNVFYTLMSPRSVRLTWSPPTQPNGFIQYYTIYYTDNITVSTQRVPGLFQWAELDGLRAGHEYRVWLSSSTSLGDGGVISDPLNFTTPEDVPSDTVHNLSAQLYGSTAVVISWDPPLEPNGRVFYQLSLQEAGITHPSINRTENQTIAKTTTDTVFLFTKLRKYFPYVLRVTPATSAGSALNHTSVLHLRTDDDVPSSAPLLGVSKNLSSTSILVSWYAPVEPNGEIIEYAAVLQGPRGSNSTHTPDLQITLTHLIPYTAYNLSIAAVTRKGTGPSLMLAMHTDEAGPMSPPRNLSIFNHSSNSVWLHWEPSLEPNGVIQHYGFKIVELNSYNVLYQNSSGASTQADLRGFKPYSSYEISVSTYTRAGNGELYSLPVTFTTHESESEAVGNLSCLGLDWDSVYMEWEPPENPNGEILVYNVVTADRRDQVLPLMPTHKLTHTFNRLHPDMPYIISVAAVNSAGPGKEANCTAWTLPESVPGPPELLPAVNLSADAVTLRWLRPSRVPGHLQGYRVQRQLLSALDGSDSKVTVVRNAGEIRMVVIGNLTSYTYYSVTVTAFTGDVTEAHRDGKTSEPITVRTLEGEPKDPPRNVTLIIIPEEVPHVYLTFLPPDEPNGNISAYHVYIYRDGRLDFEIHSLPVVSNPNQTMTAVIRGLKGAAVNGAGFGPRSEVKLTMPITAPPMPSRKPAVAINSLGAVMVTSQTISIEMPLCFFSDYNGPIQRIQVIVSEPAVMHYSNVSNWKSVFLHPTAPYVTDDGFPNPDCTEDQRSDEEMLRKNAPARMYVIGAEEGCFSDEAQTLCNGPLKPRTYYVFKFRATNILGQYTDSEYSERIRTADDGYLTRDEQIILGVLLSFFLALFLILIIYASVRIHQRQKEGGTYSPREAEIIETKLKLDQLIAMADMELKEEKIQRPISKKAFIQHVEDLCANDNAKFHEEFAELPKLLQDLATSDADLPWNRSKNRFTNIKPYNNNRVKLLSEPGIPGSDYINASFVSGYLCPNEFIATQGPLPGTVADFWRMIWETRTKSIVMLTQCFEKGRIRCHQYWPEDNKPVTVFGDIIITKLTEDVHPDWTVRALRVEAHGDYMVVHHFNYTSWPEHGVPESSSTLIQFVKAVRANRGHDNTTIVVHCRTGVFIALDHLIQHVRDHDFVDVFGLAQYMFLYQSTLDLLTTKGNSQSIWFVNYSALEKMDSLDAMEGDVELEWEETTM
ncbi:Phosphatidylinositol phosphatase PTPRQ [Bagarius yarrelli]|uniref:Phosphatidylinositol phosphatase PTPRQ n=1 Tax=Bagarius yarrelli TaxID=175774 RepID=A0A556U142_BAGYA|nr:Phosphatidylinositol phosphatase PTPRQ [Bagarius yarrelli]